VGAPAAGRAGGWAADTARRASRVTSRFGRHFVNIGIAAFAGDTTVTAVEEYRVITSVCPSVCLSVSKMDMGRVYPWIGLGWVGLGWVGLSHKFQSSSAVAELRKKVVGRRHQGAEGQPIVKYRDWQPQWGESPCPPVIRALI